MTEPENMSNVTPDERLEQRIAALRERLIFLVERLAPARSKYEYMESKTGVSAARWQNLLLRRAPPQTEMIIAVTQLRPQYVEWLITGEVCNDSDRGQNAPSDGEWQEYVDRQEFLTMRQSRS